MKTEYMPEEVVKESVDRIIWQKAQTEIKYPFFIVYYDLSFDGTFFCGSGYGTEFRHITTKYFIKEGKKSEPKEITEQIYKEVLTDELADLFIKAHKLYLKYVEIYCKEVIRISKQYKDPYMYLLNYWPISNVMPYDKKQLERKIELLQKVIDNEISPLFPRTGQISYATMD